MDLREIMKFGHIIRVREDGTILSGEYIGEGIPPVPDIHMDMSEDGHGDMYISDTDEQNMIDNMKSEGWEVLTGWSSQYSYKGPLMNDSEFVGGRLAEYIRERPGLYVRLSVEVHTDGESEYVGWIVAFQETVCAQEGCVNQANLFDSRKECLKCNPYGDSDVMNNSPDYQKWLGRSDS